MFKSVQWLVTDPCKWAAAGMAEMDTCTPACGSRCSCQWLPSCPYWQRIKISSEHLDLIKADQSAAVKASGPSPPCALGLQLCLNCPHELKESRSSFKAVLLGSVCSFLLLNMFSLNSDFPSWRSRTRHGPPDFCCQGRAVRAVTSAADTFQWICLQKEWVEVKQRVCSIMCIPTRCVFVRVCVWD